MVSTIRIVFFGTGGSWPVPERNLISIGVQIDSEILMLDCPEGAQKAIMQSTMSFMKISKIFITHLHGDHFLGLTGLVQTLSMNDRTQPLEIYCPEGAASMISSFLQIGYYSLSFDIHIFELKNEEAKDFGEYVISTRYVAHPVPTMALSIKEKDQTKISKEKMDQLGITSREARDLRNNKMIEKNGKIIELKDISEGTRKGRKIVYTSDTKPSDSLVPFAKDANVLIHDSTTDSKFEYKANEYGHSSSRQAALIAKKADCKLLILTHISPRYRSHSDLKNMEDEAKAIFPNVFLARDFFEYIVKTN